MQALFTLAYTLKFAAKEKLKTTLRFAVMEKG